MKSSHKPWRQAIFSNRYKLARYGEYLIHESLDADDEHHQPITSVNDENESQGQLLLKMQHVMQILLYLSTKNEYSTQKTKKYVFLHDQLQTY